MSCGGVVFDMLFFFTDSFDSAKVHDVPKLFFSHLLSSLSGVTLGVVYYTDKVLSGMMLQEN